MEAGNSDTPPPPYRDRMSSAQTLCCRLLSPVIRLSNRSNCRRYSVAWKDEVLRIVRFDTQKFAVLLSQWITLFAVQGSA